MSFGLAVWLALAGVPGSWAVFDGSSSRPNDACIHYVYETELGFLGQGRDRTTRAFGRAVNACNQGMRVPCLENYYNRLLRAGNRGRRAWNLAITACKDRVRWSCVEFLESQWRRLVDRKTAINYAFQGCHENMRTPCLEMVYPYARRHTRNPRKAITDTVIICRGGTSGACVVSMYEDLIPRSSPGLRDVWGNAVKACTRYQDFADVDP